MFEYLKYYYLRKHNCGNPSLTADKLKELCNGLTSSQTLLPKNEIVTDIAGDVHM